MDFTFGIITAPYSERFIDQVIASIRALHITNHEIIVIGGVAPRGDKHIEFPDDFTGAPGWITKKKNIITKYAKYPNVVYSHDYLAYDPDWYEGFTKFGDDWDVCMCKILKLSGRRHRDWCVYTNSDRSNEFWSGTESGCDDPDLPGGTLKVPYDYNKTQYMYVSGAWWVAKRDFMQQHPLDESRRMAQSEDVAWSRSVRNFWKYRMNTLSTVHILKRGK